MYLSEEGAMVCDKWRRLWKDNKTNGGESEWVIFFVNLVPTQLHSSEMTIVKRVGYDVADIL